MYLLQSIVTVIIIECLLLAGGIIGLAIISPIIPKKRLDLEQFLIGIAVGSAVLSYVIFGLAAFQGFNKLTLILLGSLWVLIGLWLGWLWQQYRKNIIVALDKLDDVLPHIRWGLVIFIVMALFNLLPALMPSTDWDGVAYHLALPKLYLEHGGFVFRPDIFHNLFPQFMEMLYSFGLFTPYGQAAKVIHFEFGMLCAFAVYVLARKMNCTLKWSMAATILFYLQYIVHIESGTTFIELSYTFYTLLGIILLFNIKQKPDKKIWPFLSILFFGITAAIKWHGLITLGLGFLAIALIVLRKTSWSQTKKLKELVMIGCIGLLPILPYFIKAFIYTGNPVWPLGYNWFGGSYWDSQLAHQVSEFHATYAGWQHSWQGFFTLPYDLIFHSNAFSVGAVEFRLPLLASMILGCLVLILNRKQILQFKRIGWLVFIIALHLLFLAIWFKSSPQFRFLLPLLPIWSVLVIKGLKICWESKQKIIKGAAVAIGLLLVAVHPPVHKNTFEQISVLLGLKSPDEYCSRYLKHYKACLFLNRFVGAHEKVMLFGENRGFYLDCNYIWGDPMLQKIIDYRSMVSSTELADKLISHQINWVLWRDDLYQDDYFPPEIKNLMQHVLEQHGEMVFVNKSVKVFKLNFQKYALARKN